ncbi:hypothetical protein [Saliniramus fredricksonii]|uniref:hypothetical protein n=1 Tax=Saliniramus fredricksonii TaxID=1653334 RepID=UPI0010421B9A|nr:hypothetical protein [Saliniramus fredricksonii]
MCEGPLQFQRLLTLAGGAQFLRAFAHELLKRPAGSAAGFFQFAQEASTRTGTVAYAVRPLHAASGLPGEIAIALAQLAHDRVRNIRPTIRPGCIGALTQIAEKLCDGGRISQRSGLEIQAAAATQVTLFVANCITRASLDDDRTPSPVHRADFFLQSTRLALAQERFPRQLRFRRNLLRRRCGGLAYRRLIRKLSELDGPGILRRNAQGIFAPARRRAEIGNGMFERIALRGLR